jgi:hypothetical protein
MIRNIRNRVMPLAFLAVALSPTTIVSAPLDSPAKNPAYKLDQLIILKEAGKRDRRCVVISIKPSSDGVTTYQVQALDTGETLTVLEHTPTATKFDHSEGNIATMPKPAISKAEKSRPQSPGLLDRIFGRSTPPCSVCEQQPQRSSACNSGQTRSSAGMTTVATREPPIERVPADPAPIGFVPPMPTTASQAPSSANEPASLPLDQAPVDPARQAIAYEQNRTAELKDALKNAERPSHRITAAEELASGARGASDDVRAALMLAAQDDPASCVRAACIRVLSHRGVRDQAFMTVLVSAQHDKDPAVRDEAGYAMKIATHR